LAVLQRVRRPQRALLPPRSGQVETYLLSALQGERTGSSTDW